MMLKKKGVALFLALFVSLIIFIIIIGLLYILSANIRQLQAYDERTRAYYLMETAASVAILDIGHGKIGKEPGKWTERTVNLLLDDKTYPIKYTVTREDQAWIVTMDSSGFRRPYHFRVGGMRGYLVYILRGFGGK